MSHNRKICIGDQESNHRPLIVNKRFTRGEHVGKCFADVPTRYLMFIYENASLSESDRDKIANYLTA